MEQVKQRPIPIDRPEPDDVQELPSILPAMTRSGFAVLGQGSERGMKGEQTDEIGQLESVKPDRPLRGMPHPFDKLHPQMYASELAGTAVSRLWEGWWIYWLGPCLGAALAVLLLRNDLLKHLRPVEARLCHFGHHGATGKV